MNHHGVCEICHENLAYYTCPACKIHTCCVECCKRHKEELNCSGIRPKTTFIPLDQMNSTTLINDCKLLDSAIEAKEDAEMVSKNQGFSKTKSKQKWKKVLKKACEERAISIDFFPLQSTRSKENSTRYIQSQGYIAWTVLWRFRLPDKTIIYKYLANNQNGSANFGYLFRAILELSPDDYVASLNDTCSTAILVAEGAPGGGYYEIDFSATLDENLCLKSVYEYPIIEVIPENCLNDYKIVDITQVKKIPNPKEQIPPPKPQVLPSYDQIKAALKMDLLNGAIATINDEDENIKNNLQPHFD